TGRRWWRPAGLRAHRPPPHRETCPSGAAAAATGQVAQPWQQHTVTACGPGVGSHGPGRPPQRVPALGPPGCWKNEVMDPDQAWTAVDDYFIDELVAQDQALLDTAAGDARTTAPGIAVSPPQGKLLALFAEMVGA